MHCTACYMLGPRVKLIEAMNVTIFIPNVCRSNCLLIKKNRKAPTNRSFPFLKRRIQDPAEGGTSSEHFDEVVYNVTIN